MRRRTFMYSLICLEYVVSCTPPHPDCVILVNVRTKTTTNPICSYNSPPFLFCFVLFLSNRQCYPDPVNAIQAEDLFAGKSARAK